MPPDPLGTPRRLLVVRLDNLGDVVLTSPLVRALRSAYPGADITLLGSAAGTAAATLLPWYDHVLETRAVWQDVGGRMPFDPARERAFVDRLAAGRFDAAIICTSFSQTPYPFAYAAYLAGIPIRVGFAGADEFGGSVLSHVVEPPPAGTHQAERNLRLLDGLGIPVDERGPAIRIPEGAARWADRWFAATGVDVGRAVAIVPGASCESRRWPPERYGIVARGLAAAGRRVLVLGTEKEGHLAGPILEACPSAVSLVGQTSVAQLAAILDRAGLVLCGNSAALHLADAVDRPIVALYSGTDRESEWGPRRAPATLFRVPTACAPCRRFDCPFELACLDIDPATVVSAVLTGLAGPPGEEEACVASAS